jgi:hypothetical protein
MMTKPVWGLAVGRYLNRQETAGTVRHHGVDLRLAFGAWWRLLGDDDDRDRGVAGEADRG